MIDEIVGIASDLVAFPSTAGNPGAREDCAAYLEDFFQRADLPCSSFEQGGVRSLLVGLGEEPPLVCLNGHYDVVEAPTEAFRARREGDRLYGRGAADMKGSLAAMMVLVRDLARRPQPPSLALMAVGDEETGGELGTARVLGLGFRCGFALAGEPTGLEVSHQSKGVLGVELVARGASAHSARPWEGDNAILAFFRKFPAVAEVLGTPEPGAWKTTAVPTVLRAGDAVNRVPDQCACRLDIRYIPGDRPEEIIARLRAAGPDLEVRVAEDHPPFHTDPDNPYLQSLLRAAEQVQNRKLELIRKHAASDARFFTGHGIPAAVFGPGGEHIHGDGEWVDLNQVSRFYEVLERFVETVTTIGKK